jgi:hypothetical protein
MDEETKEFLIEIADYLDSIHGKFDGEYDWTTSGDCWRMECRVREFVTRRSASSPTPGPRQI